jgi:pimeloyl-ACP methyl ester carboxylesterase
LVLAVHGMTSSRKSWEQLATHLDGRFRVAAYDQRGHGDSAGQGGSMALTRGVADAVDVAAALHAPIDVLLGHSWGGAVALIAGTMIHQAGDEWYGEFLAELEELFALQGEARDARVREEYADWSAVDVAAKVHAVHAMTTAPIAGLRDANPPATWSLGTELARYRKPVLLAMAARGEGINDDATMDELARGLAPGVTTVEFPGAGHNLHRTAFPAFARAFDGWLESSEVRR